MVCFLLLCGCSAKETVKPVLEGVSFDAVVNYEGYECKCSVKAYGGGVFNCTINSPAAISGASVNFDGEEMKITFMGLEYEPPLPLPCENIAEIFKTVVDAAADGVAGITADGHYNIVGRTGDYNYVVTVTEAGLPVKIVCEDIGFIAEITNASII